jgi:hypothetical protein
MNSRGLLIFFAIPILTVTSLLFINNAAFLGGVEQNRINEIRQQQEMGKAPASPSDKIPSDIDFIQMFFQALQDKNTSLSLGMLDPSNLPDEATLKEWEKYFSSFEKAQVVSVDPENPDSWALNEHTYKVSINVSMIAEAASATIPNYGWQNGDNIRWVTVRRGEDGLWRVLEIATGP